jgi:hypothetical protein
MSIIMIGYILTVFWLRFLVDNVQNVSSAHQDTSGGMTNDVEMDKIHLADMNMSDVYDRESEFDFSVTSKSSMSSKLQTIVTDINAIFDKCNNGLPFDALQLEKLLMSIERNPDLKKEYRGFARDWHSIADVYAQTCLNEMRGYVPKNIATSNCTIDSLIQDGMSASLAKRIYSKQALWLLSLTKDEISMLDEKELYSKYNPLDQNLDIVELAAIYAVLPTKYFNDHVGRKEVWSRIIEGLLKNLMELRDNNQLNPTRLRNTSYQGQKQLYQVVKTNNKFKENKKFNFK